MGNNEKVNSNKLFCTLKISKGLIEYVQKKIKFFLSQSWQMQGALIGGILLGIIEILGRAYISSQLSDAIVFAVLIIVLLVKPTGILGKQIHEKV